ncbi:MAG: hypothetical protein ACUVRP_08325, partial [Chlorobiales bacterium]
VNSTKPTSQLDQANKSTRPSQQVNSTKWLGKPLQAFSPKKRGKWSKTANCQYPAFKAVLDIKGNPDQMPIRQIRVYWGNGKSTIVHGVNNIGNGTRISMTYTFA